MNTAGPQAPPHCHQPTSTLATAMLQVLVGRVHLVWVLNDEKRPVGVVTLSDILRIFYRHACA